jgi:2,3-bisphosphoglycerate-independent phosphoglycerate mutase
LARPENLLADQPQANFHTMRGFAEKPRLPSYGEVYGLRAAAIAVYPMYKGLARLVGMDIVGQAQTLEEQPKFCQQNWNDYDFFFLHFKYPDSTGEDGNFDGESPADRRAGRHHASHLPRESRRADRHRRPQHPGFLKSHSWHPVPTLLVSDCCRPDAERSSPNPRAFAAVWGRCKPST